MTDAQDKRYQLDWYEPEVDDSLPVGWVLGSAYSDGPECPSVWRDMPGLIAVLAVRKTPNDRLNGQP